MDYDEIAAGYLTPSVEPVPEPAVPESPARRLRDALEPIATIGWWSRAAAEAATSVGLDFFGGYVWGRAAALGADASPPVVVAAFGVFDADMVTGVLAGARAVTPHASVLAAREAGATAGLAAAAGDVDPAVIGSLGDRLAGALKDVDGAARPLFSGLRALPMPEDPYGRLWRCAELVREHRGDGHLAACVAAGLTALEMNVMTELWLDYSLGEYSSTRGFDDAAITAAAHGLRDRGWVTADDRLTDRGREVREGIEAATDESQAALVRALGPDIDEVTAQAQTVGAAVLAALAAPADARKRAAG